MIRSFNNMIYSKKINYLDIIWFENMTLLIKTLFFVEELILAARIRRWRDQYPDAPWGRAPEEHRMDINIYEYECI